MESIVRSGDVNPPAPPIRVAAKQRSNRGAAAAARNRKRYVHPLFSDRGFPHPQDDFESMLPDVKHGKLIRKRKHKPPSLQDIDPGFGEEYCEAKHGKILRDELNVAHLTDRQKVVFTNVIKKYWRVFSKKGVTTPVKDYECEIDTGNARPI